MKIEVSKLKTEVIKFENLIEELENIYLNYYNQVSSCSSFWQDKYEVKFMDQVKSEKTKYKTMIRELKTLNNIYSYLVDEYQKIGRKIVADLDMKEEVMGNFNKYIAELDSLISDYDRLDLSFCYDERSYLLNEKERFKKSKNDILDVKENTKDMFDKIEKIEKQVQLNLSKLDISIVKEEDITGLY